MPGRLAFVSQSGALVTAMLDWAAERHIGFSSVVSAGDMADVDLGDLIDKLATDPATDAILLYVEGITDAPKFLSAARAASAVKPVVAIKAGRSANSSKAALSHTGALIGAYDAHRAAFDRAGIVTVDSLTELFDAAQLLCRCKPTTGERLAIISNGGGAGVLAADALAQTGGRLANLSEETISGLDGALPQGWSRANPIDVVGDARAERFIDATIASLADPGVDAVLVIHCPTAVATGEEIARDLTKALAERAGAKAKPVIACWMGPANAETARPDFDAAGIPMFDNLDDAVRGFGYLLRAGQARAARMRAPAPLTLSGADRGRAATVIADARSAGRSVLNAIETRSILAAYGVPVVDARFARTAEGLARQCDDLWSPFVLKIVSADLTHKSDAGGVAFGLPSREATTAAAGAMAERIAREHPEAHIDGFEVQHMVAFQSGMEMFAGFAVDPTFGPMLAFGTGGKAVELVHDRALGLPPLDDGLAMAMIENTRIAKLLVGYRDVPAADLDAIVRVLNALSQIAIDHPEIAELDINPLVPTPGGVVALDARARIADPAHRTKLAIQPYPVEWEADLTTRSNVALHIRPVRPDDEAALAAMFAAVSAEDLRFRFLSGVSRVGHDRLVPMTQVDYRRTINFLAFAGEQLIASAMLASDPDGERAELALAVRADFKGKGVSWTLVDHVMRYARAKGIETIESVESRDNHAAIALEREAGFEIAPHGDCGSEVIVRRRVAA
jgi:acetyltransferase